MNLDRFKQELSKREKIAFELPNGELVPAHFHVTEVGNVTKHFIDCGGTMRLEQRVNFQLWEANDYDHRLHPEKLLSIIELSEKRLGLTNQEIEVEYQGATIGKYGIELKGDHFLLKSLTTDCLAKDKCGIPTDENQVNNVTSTSNNTCTPGSGCC